MISVQRIPYEAVGATWVIKVDGQIVAHTTNEGWARLIAERLEQR